jgi:uncharacterized damage-inducible protein DinB
MKKRESSVDPVREHLVQHLSGSGAHISFKAAIKDFPLELAGKRVPNLAHTAWGLLWHINICQSDILEYALHAGSLSPAYPSGYWPKEDGPADAAEWKKRDLKKIVDMVSDPERDLGAPMRDGLDESLLQMAMLVIDHNSYHLGQIVDIRMLLGAPVKDY